MLDLSLLTREQKLQVADRIKSAYDFNLPNLDYLNTLPCESHDELTSGCRRCGLMPRRHQRTAIAWLYTRERGLIADPVGSGKTLVAGGVMALLKQTGELSPSSRAIVICRPAAIGQWSRELYRMLPSLNIETATGSKSQRIDKYTNPWDIMIVGYQMLSNDLEAFMNFRLGFLAIDDVDPIKTRSNQTAYSVKRLARETTRVGLLTATPLQKRLLELYSMLEVIGGRDTLGTETSFKRDYIIPGTKPIQYRNLTRFKAKLAPMALRRTPEEMDDVELPALIPSNVFLELYESQRAKYQELRNGVLRIIREEGEEVKYAEAMAKWTYGQQICAGLCALGEEDRPFTSVKLDWVEDKLIDGDFSEEKVVVFAHNQNTIKAIQARLSAAQVGFETIWGKVSNVKKRTESQERFWDDPNCKVMIGSTSIEQSMNLQIARHMICVDHIMNAARMTQLSGRIRRQGSAYRTVYVHSLFTVGTQEDSYLDLLQREASLADYVWDEENEMYPPLTGIQLLRLIGNTS